uniref:adenosine deaminase n=1 Tax=Denticeps clupeoides TaxID=299321 RepID=A0AAY4AWM1_9TELE
AIIRGKVELHVHLDGAMRVKTIFEVAKQRGIALPLKNVEELQCLCTLQEPSCLTDFLSKFSLFMPVIRIAYEFVEDKAKRGWLMWKVRYSPHLLANSTWILCPGIRKR